MSQENFNKEKLSKFEIAERMKNVNLQIEFLKQIEPQTDYISMMKKFKDILKNKNSNWTLNRKL